MTLAQSKPGLRSIATISSFQMRRGSSAMRCASPGWQDIHRDLTTIGPGPLMRAGLFYGECHATKTGTVATQRLRIDNDQCAKEISSVGFCMWQPISSAPLDRDLELAVIDAEGEHVLA